MIYLNNLIESLKVLADVEAQKRIWLSSSEPEVGDFAEEICQTFDDTGLSYYIDRDQCPPELDVHVFEALKKLDVVASKVDYYDVGPEDLIEDVKMEEVRKVASTVLNLLEGNRRTEGE